MSKVKKKRKVRKAKFSLFSYSGTQEPSDDSDDSDYKPVEEPCTANRKSPIPILKISTDASGKVFRRITKKASRKSKKKSKDSGDDEAKLNHDLKNDHSANSNGVCETANNLPSRLPRLPDECLLRIFQYVIVSEGTTSFLTRFPRVSKHWNEICDGSALYRRVDMSRTPNNHKDASISRFFKEKVGHLAHDVNLSGWSPKLTKLGITTIIESCPHLRHVNLSGCRVLRDHHIQLLADLCPHLTSVDLSHLKTSKNMQNPLSVRSLKYLFCKLGENLKHFSIANNSDVQLSAILSALGETCHGLRVLDVSNVQQQDNCNYKINIESLQKDCPKLQVLRLANTPFLFQQVPLLDQAASRGFPELEELSIARFDICYQQLVDDNCIERILKTSEKLKLLDLRGRAQISTSSLVRLPAWHLEHLFLSKCTAVVSNGLDLVMQKWCHSLKEVDLSWNSQCGNAVDNAVNALALCPTPSCLYALDLCGSAVSFQALKNVMLKCPSIRVLNLSSCRGLPRGIKRKFEGSSLDQLKLEIASLKYDTIDED